MGGIGGKFSRQFATDVATKVMSKLEGVKRFEICGSIRRQKDEVGDIDIVVVPSDVKKFYSSAEKISKGSTLAVGVRNIRFIKNGIQIDFMVVDDDSFESAILHLTGSKYFNIRCRTRAKELGYMLNEYGLWEGEKRRAKTELGILKALEMEKYLDPTTRK